MPSVDYDNHWKEIITNLFEDFIGFFLPEAYPLIDFTVPPVFLEQELLKILADNKKKGKKVNDKLVKVHLKDGTDQWILIHIEVQISSEVDFTRRMFTYFYRIFDQYSREITAIAIYVGERIPRNYGSFEYNFLGTSAFYKFNTYLVKKADEKELIRSNNPFALAVLATRYSHKTKKDANRRLEFKMQLIRLAKEKQYSKDRIINLLRFISLILALPDLLEKQFFNLTVNEFIKKEDMQKVSDEWMNQLSIVLYGETLADRDARLRKEDRAKIKAEKEKSVEYLLLSDKLSAKEIAEALDVSLALVKRIQAKM